MNREIMKKFFAMVLVGCLVFSQAAPVFAAKPEKTVTQEEKQAEKEEKKQAKEEEKQAKKEEKKAKKEEKKAEKEEKKANKGDKKPEVEETLPEETQPEETLPEIEETQPEQTKDAELYLIEDETTVTEGTKLRATTFGLVEDAPAVGYALSRAVVPFAAGDSSTPTDVIKYFPATLFNYDKNTINNATHQVEVDAALANGGIDSLTKWNGLYFIKDYTNPSSFTYTSDEPVRQITPVVPSGYNSTSNNANVTFESGTYYLKNERSGAYLTATATGERLVMTTDVSKATAWQVTRNTNNGTYTIRAGNNGPYLTIGNGTAGTRTSTNTSTTIRIIKFNNGSNGQVLIGARTSTSSNTYYYLNNWNQGGKEAGGYSSNTDGGSVFFLCQEQDVYEATTGSLSYAPHNFWTGLLTDEGALKWNSYGSVNWGETYNRGKVYGGLAKDRLVNGNIAFNVPDAGIFDAKDTTTKDVYTNVGIPFVYNAETQRYEFDSAADSARFVGGAASGKNLTWNDDPQMNNYKGDELAEGFYPFNEQLTMTTEAEVNYYFGMNFSVDFSVNPNGRINPDDSTSEAIDFKFSGDDDVWVFIDDILVLDLGGIHDAVDGAFDFAKNTITLKANSNNYTSGDVAGEFTEQNAEAGEAITIGRLFNDETGTGVLGQDLQSFAATEHTLTFYYLERGAGDANCKISFNLPQRDYVSVSKNINPYLYDKGDENKRLDLISDTLLESLNNRNFTFVLYHNGEAMANAKYAVYALNGTYLQSGSTDENGQFHLKNGQTVRFFVNNLSEGDSYNVKEINPGDAWGTATWVETAQIAGGFVTDEIKDTQDAYNSDMVTANGGSVEAADYVAFTCTNKMLSPVTDIDNETVVIDYGLHDVIDVVANDTYSDPSDYLVVRGLSVDGKTFASSVTGKFGTATIVDGKVSYQLNKQMTGVETIQYELYLASDTDKEECMGVGTLTIIPATSMYYEENFGFVNFGAGWTAVGTPETDPQEEGRVGTIGDSPYGSDAAYHKDSGDSNGSSMYVSTANGAASFSYTFTGTGTTFFARTTNNSGYINVFIKNADGKQVYEWHRDTSYKTDNAGTTLYNIPVFTYEELDYGTYTVEVEINKGFAFNETTIYGSDFWLDGIRVINPVDLKSPDYQTADAAYREDGEANMTSVTLRDKIISEYTTEDEEGNVIWDENHKFVVFTDTNGEIVLADEYISNGPKEELYLNAGQSFRFTLANWDPAENKLYIGIKAPMGASKVTVNGQQLNINNATDCYYEIPASWASLTQGVDGFFATYTIAATEGLTSVTNLKVTGDAYFAIIPGTDIEGD